MKEGNWERNKNQNSKIILNITVIKRKKKIEVISI